MLASPMLASKAVVSEGAAGEAEVVVPGYPHAMEVDHSRSGVVGVICGQIVGWTSAINRGLAGGHIDGVGQIHRHALPFFVCHNEGKGTRDVMHGAHASSVCFHVLGPSLEVVTRVISKRWGDACQGGRHFAPGNGDGWMLG